MQLTAIISGFLSLNLPELLPIVGCESSRAVPGVGAEDTLVSPVIMPVAGSGILFLVVGAVEFGSVSESEQVKLNVDRWLTNKS